MNVLEFQHVSFRYSEDSKYVLHDVNFSLEKGKKYALVGPTGQGKSTIANLVSGLYSPEKGKVLYEGVDVSLIPRNELYKKIGFILQDPFLFSGTVLDNIVYGNEDFQQWYIQKTGSEMEMNHPDPELEKDVSNVLKLNGLESLLEVFPERLKTQVSNNSENISLGQKQIINFLRVVLRKPEFMILDEATANLDTITEKNLQHIIAGLPEQTTKLIIAHRLNTIQDVDAIFRVGGGKVAREENKMLKTVQ